MVKGLQRSLSRGPAIRDEIIKQTFTFNAQALNVAAAGAGVGFGSIVLGDFPEGNILLLGAVLYVAGECSDASLADTWEGDFAVGSAPNDGTLTGTKVDIVPSTAVAATDKDFARQRAAGATQTILDNTDGSLELNLNLNVDAADITDAEDGDVNVTGDLTLAYIVLADD